MSPIKPPIELWDETKLVLLSWLQLEIEEAFLDFADVCRWSNGGLFIVIITYLTLYVDRIIFVKCMDLKITKSGCIDFIDFQ